MATAPKKTKDPKGKAKTYRRFKALPASRVASSLLSPAIRAKGFAQAEVVTRWPQIVGAELAGSCVPQRMIFPRGERMGAKLVIRCTSAFATLLDHKAPQIIEMVNSFFGYGAVATIEIKQGPIKILRRKPTLTKKQLSEDNQAKLNGLVCGSELSPVQKAVKSLGEMVLSNDKEKE